MPENENEERVKGSSRQQSSFVAEEVLREREGEISLFRSKHASGVEEGRPGRSSPDDKVMKRKTV